MVCFGSPIIVSTMILEVGTTLEIVSVWIFKVTLEVCIKIVIALPHSKVAMKAGIVDV